VGVHTYPTATHRVSALFLLSNGRTPSISNLPKTNQADIKPKKTYRSIVVINPNQKINKLLTMLPVNDDLVIELTPLAINTS
jgi:hypothetical protein